MEQEQDGLEVVELDGEATATAPVEAELVELPPKKWRYRALVIGLAVLLVGGVGAVLLMPEGERTPEQVLADIRAFVKDERSATFTGLSESTFGSGSANEVGHSSTSRTQISGEIRLPDEAHIVSDSGDWADETIIHGDDVYVRNADSKAELASEKWAKWNTFGTGPGNPVTPSAAGVPPAVLADAASFMTTMSSGFPVDLDTLFAKLSKPTRVSPTRIQATVKMGDLIPAEVRAFLEEQKAEFEKQMAEAKAAAEQATDDGEESVELFEDELGMGDFAGAFDLNFDTPLTVAVEYGPEGRLDALFFDTQDDMGDGDVSKEHDEVRFANWGKPVTIALPTGDQVDATPNIDEEGLARMQAKTAVLGLSALPSGWVLGSLEIQEFDDDAETCDSLDLEYVAGSLGDPDAVGFKMPPQISISTVAKCEYLDENLPDLEDARTVRVGPWTAKLVDDAADNMFTYLDEGVTAVLVVNGVTVVAASNLPEAEFLQHLRSLAPFDLGKVPIEPSEE